MVCPLDFVHRAESVCSWKFDKAILENGCGSSSIVGFYVFFIAKTGTFIRHLFYTVGDLLSTWTSQSFLCCSCFQFFQGHFLSLYGLSCQTKSQEQGCKECVLTHTCTVWCSQSCVYAQAAFCLVVTRISQTYNFVPLEAQQRWLTGRDDEDAHKVLKGIVIGQNNLN